MCTPFVVVLIVIAFIIILGVYQKINNGVCTSKKMLTGKVAVVTGGTNGIGLVIATDFARRGAKVIIACPFAEEGTYARKHIVDETGNANVLFKHLDLSSLKSVRDFAKDVLATEKRLDILVNNAGVGAPNDFTTADGMSFIMQVHYFGHFLLTLLLLPLLKKSGNRLEPSRIVIVSSIMHCVGKIDLIPRNSKNLWQNLLVYSNSKFCLLLFTHELSKRLNSDVVVNSVHPGLVGTRIYNSAGSFLGTIVRTFLVLVFKTAWDGAQAVLHVALDDEAGGVSGQYFVNCKLSRATKTAYDDSLSRTLWKKSAQLVQLSDDEIEKCLM